MKNCNAITTWINREHIGPMDVNRTLLINVTTCEPLASSREWRTSYFRQRSVRILLENGNPVLLCVVRDRVKVSRCCCCHEFLSLTLPERWSPRTFRFAYARSIFLTFRGTRELVFVASHLSKSIPRLFAVKPRLQKCEQSR